MLILNDQQFLIKFLGMCDVVRQICNKNIISHYVHIIITQEMAHKTPKRANI